MIASGDLDESLAVQELASKVEIRQALALHSLGHRFGVLAALPVIDAETLPIGPAKLGAALRHAAACLDISVEQRVLLYHTFDRIAMNHIGTFYDAANAYFVDQGILKHLHLYLHLRLQAAQGKSSLSLSPTDTADTPNRAPAGAMSVNYPTADTTPVRDAPAAAATLPTWVPPAPQRGAAADERDSELFTTLRELLAGAVSARVAAERAAHGYVPSGEDVQSVLGALQSKPIVADHDGRQAGAAFDCATQAGPAQPIASSSRRQDIHRNWPNEDSDTIDLVGMLFDYLSKNVRRPTAAPRRC